MSPFMIGPYYRPQLTSMLSIMHRGTGVFLALVSLLMPVWLLALAGGPEPYARFMALAAGPLGLVLLAAIVFSLFYHLFNGLRHLAWDVGWGFELSQTYATGYAVVVLAVISTAVVLWFLMGGTL